MNLERTLTKPAFLLGNGLNNHANLPISWIDLLMRISGGAITRESLDEKEITYPEFYDAVCFYNKNATKEYVSLKDEICKEISKWKTTDYHRPLIDFAKTNSIPIMTTNYDGTLLTDSIISHHKDQKCPMINGFPLPLKMEKNGFTDFYPWYSYYSDHIVNDVKSEFAIWHIHGMQCYKRSISIGAIDYANNISRIKKYLPKKNSQNIHWLGCNSWLDIFFHCDLVIIGLSLGAQETSLRWLLMEREKYYRKNPSERRQTIYVINKQYDKCGDGKTYLFNSLSINITQYDSADEIFNEMSWG